MIKPNFLVAMVLSFAVLFGWDAFVMGPRRHAAERAVVERIEPKTEVAPAVVSSTVRAEAAEKFAEVSLGQNRLSFAFRGAAIKQWWIRETAEGGPEVPLLPEGISTGLPFSTFPDLDFKMRQNPPSEVVFEASRSDGLRVRKTYRIDPNGRIHRVILALENKGKAPLEVSTLMGWGPSVGSADGKAKNDGNEQRALALEVSPSLKKPRLLNFKNSVRQESSFQWWGLDGHYFLAAFLNDSGEPLTLNVQKVDKHHFVIQKEVRVSLPPGQSFTEDLRLYVGPKRTAELAALGLERAVDFGFFASLGKLIHRALFFFQKITGNYGWAIILLTCVIQVLMLPLTIKGFHYSQKMKALQPQMTRLKTLYGTDPKRMNAEMLNLYQKHGLRFMGMEGCFPMLLQMPIFFSLYTALRNTYELRHAPWIGWIRNLSAQDPYFVLPVLMGAGMLAQQKMTMNIADPTHWKELS